MALQFNRTDADTGHRYTVYARIDQATVLLGQETTLTLNLYDSVTAASQGLQPVLPPDMVTFLADEMAVASALFVQALAVAVQGGLVQSPVDALKTALYTLVKGRPTYSGAVNV